MKPRVAFIGSTRLGQPLDPTNEKKFRRLEEIAEVVVVGFARDGRPRWFDQHARFYLLPVPGLAVARYALAVLMSTVVTLWVVFRHRTSVLIAQSPHEAFGPALVKLLLRRIGRRVALVVESHGDFEVSIFLQRRVLFAPLYQFLMRWTARFALRQADALRSISESTQRQLATETAKGLPMVRFPTWSDIEVFLEAGHQSDGERRPRHVLYAGVLIPRKGVHVLLPAFATAAREVVDAKLFIVGGEPNPEYASDMKRLAQDLGINERLEFLGAMSQQSLAQLMASVAAFVLPSTSEGLGRVVFEAMACGTPVIGSQVGGIAEQISDGENGFLVPPADVDALAERLLWTLRHPVEARQMGERARLAAQTIFSTEAYLRGYATLLELASHHSSSHPR